MPLRAGLRRLADRRRDASVDVVTTRSVLIYVKDKAAAHAGVLPGAAAGRAGQLVRAGQRADARDRDRFLGYDVTPVKALAAKVQALYESIQPPGADPMLDFDERDLVRHARDAGFREVSLELRVSVKNRKDPCPGNGSCACQATRCSRPSRKPCSRSSAPRRPTSSPAISGRSWNPGLGWNARALAYLTAVKG